MIAHVAISQEMILPAGKEMIITFDKTIKDAKSHHTKKEYLKIHDNGRYQVDYQVKWTFIQQTTQPLKATLYKVLKEYEIVPIQQNVTVCTGNAITLNKKIQIDGKSGERICLGVKNFSYVDFKILDASLSLTRL